MLGASGGGETAVVVGMSGGSGGRGAGIGSVSAAQATRRATAGRARTERFTREGVSPPRFRIAAGDATLAPWQWRALPH